MGEVGRKAVADIDARRGQFSPQQGLADVQTRLRKQVRMTFGRRHAVRMRLCRLSMVANSAAAPPSCPVTYSASPATAPDRRSASPFGADADQHNIREDEATFSARRFGGVSACKRHTVHLAQRAQSAEEACDPRAACRFCEHRRRAAQGRGRRRVASRPSRQGRSARVPGSGGRPIPEDADRGGSAGPRA